MTFLQERRTRVMGTDAHVVLHGGDTGSPHDIASLDDAERQIRSLEARWSRFIEDSEVSQLNRASGDWAAVGPETALLVELGVVAWERTGGRFDPTVGAAVVATGYDRTFSEVLRRAPGSARREQVAPGPAPGCGDIGVAAGVGLVRLPSGTWFDPGGIGKGLAADLVVAQLLAWGVAGALVSVGGDLRVGGCAPDGGWVIEVDHDGGAPIGRVGLLDGALATSSVRRRRWSTADGDAHHVIDPRTGRPTSGAAVACSVVAGEAWWAEALATAVLVAWDEPGGPEIAAGLVGDAAAVVTTASGEIVRLGPPHVGVALEDVA